MLTSSKFLRRFIHFAQSNGTQLFFWVILVLEAYIAPRRRKTSFTEVCPILAESSSALLLGSGKIDLKYNTKQGGLEMVPTKWGVPNNAKGVIWHRFMIKSICFHSVLVVYFLFLVWVCFFRIPHVCNFLFQIFFYLFQLSGGWRGYFFRTTDYYSLLNSILGMGNVFLILLF